MYETVFKNIDDALRTDEGCSGAKDYIEQTSWILFLKYLEDYETSEEEMGKGLSGKPYKRIIKGKYRWSEWAVPKTADGELDHDRILTGKDLLDFVNTELFSYLADFKNQADNPRSLEYKIGEIFGDEVRNRLRKGKTLREVIEKIDKLKFLDKDDKNELSELYENKIKEMGNAGIDGGEYYTPRPVVKSIIEVINPQIGETVYDGAVGSAGFLCEAFAWMKEQVSAVTQYKRLQEKTLFGKEKKPMPYVIGIMNMILHGIEYPNIIRTNTLEENILDIQNKDRHDIVLANPPFGAAEDKDVPDNFPIRTSETAYLFLQHFIKILKKGGRGGIVIKNTFFSNTDNASIALRKQLLEECNLFAVLDLPPKVFTCAGVKTVVLFFKKGEPTKKIWYYQLNLDRTLGKTNPINETDLAEFIKLSKKFGDSENSWSINIKDIDKETYDLSVKNPNKKEKIDSRTPKEIIKGIEDIDKQANSALQAIKELL